MGIKVSVIMPIYNAEEFLNDTLRDVTGQTLKEIEIICVDDGSKDRSKEIIEEWQKRDNRIQLLAQQNQYAGVARNNGFAKAKGEYVIFWDSDDMYHAKALEIMYQKAVKEDADICLCAANRYDMDKKKLITCDTYLKTNLLPTKEVFNKFDLSEHIFNIATNVPWNKLYRRTFVEKHELKYQALKQANDTYFTMVALFLAERITYVKDVLISYRTNNSQSISGKASDTVLCPYVSYVATADTLKGHPDYEVVRKSFLNKALSGLYNALNIQTTFTGYEQLYNVLVQEGFEKLGLKDCQETDIHVGWHYRDLQKMLTMSAGDFLIQKSNERRQNAEREKAENKLLRKYCIYNPLYVATKLKRKYLDK